ncbi:hypothetical protein RI367_004079 [Sorochytrium milnesiophthora]
MDDDTASAQGSIADGQHNASDPSTTTITTTTAADLTANPAYVETRELMVSLNKGARDKITLRDLMDVKLLHAGDRLTYANQYCTITDAGDLYVGQRGVIPPYMQSSYGSLSAWCGDARRRGGSDKLKVNGWQSARLAADPEKTTDDVRQLYLRLLDTVVERPQKPVGPVSTRSSRSGLGGGPQTLQGGGDGFMIYAEDYSVTTTSDWGVLGDDEQRKAGRRQLATLELMGVDDVADTDYREHSSRRSRRPSSSSSAAARRKSSLASTLVGADDPLPAKRQRLSTHVEEVVIVDDDDTAQESGSPSAAAAASRSSRKPNPKPRKKPDPTPIQPVAVLPLPSDTATPDPKVLDAAVTCVDCSALVPPRHKLSEPDNTQTLSIPQDLASQANVLTCLSCSEPHHAHCTPLYIFPPPPNPTDPWVCINCTFCNACNQSLPRDQLARCVQCGNVNHLSCINVSPEMIRHEDGTIYCQDCTQCFSCGTKPTPGVTIGVPLWNRHPALSAQLQCQTCQSLYLAGNFCPVCLKVYRDDDYETEMVGCDGPCGKWVHTACDPELLEKRYENLSNEQGTYLCPDCRHQPKGGAEGGRSKHKSRGSRRNPKPADIPIVLPAPLDELPKVPTTVTPPSPTGSDSPIEVPAVQVPAPTETIDLSPVLEPSVPSVAAAAAVTDDLPPLSVDAMQVDAEQPATVAPAVDPSRLQEAELLVGFGNSQPIDGSAPTEAATAPMEEDAHGLAEHIASRTCGFCNYSQNAPATGRLIHAGGHDNDGLGKWLHAGCIMWSVPMHAISFEGVVLRRELRDVQIKSRLRMCARCSQPFANITCSHPACSVSYHYPCLIQATTTDRDNVEPMHVDLQQRILRCADHLSQQYPPMQPYMADYVQFSLCRLSISLPVSLSLQLSDLQSPTPGMLMTNAEPPGSACVVAGNAVVTRIGQLPYQNTDKCVEMIDRPGAEPTLVPIGYTVLRRFWSYRRPAELTTLSISRCLERVPEAESDTEDEEETPATTTTVRPVSDKPAAAESTTLPKTVSLADLLKGPNALLSDPSFTQKIAAAQSATTTAAAPQSHTTPTPREFDQGVVRDGQHGDPEVPLDTFEIHRRDRVTWLVTVDDDPDGQFRANTSLEIVERLLAKFNPPLPISVNHHYLQKPASFVMLHHPLVVKQVEGLPHAAQVKQYTFSTLTQHVVSATRQAERALRRGCSRTDAKFNKYWSTANSSMRGKSTSAGVGNEQDLLSPGVARGRAHASFHDDDDDAAISAYTGGAGGGHAYVRRGDTETILLKPVTARFREMKFAEKVNAYVRPSKIHGIGLFAGRSFERDDLICEYLGECIGQKVADRREVAYEQQGIGTYFFAVDYDRILDATVTGNMARFVNHSCDPNCSAKILTIDDVKRVIIFAARNIDSGEELTYDYKFQPEDEPARKLRCFCGAKNCRGYMN